MTASNYQVDPEEMDDIHHALGRPKRARAIPKAYRNHYCCAVDGDISRRNRQSPAWTTRMTINDGRDTVWQVTEWGKARLAEHLDGK